MNNDPNQPPQPTNPYVQPQVVAPQQPIQSVEPMPQPFQPVINPTTVGQVAPKKATPMVVIIILVVVLVVAIALSAFVFVTMK